MHASLKANEAQTCLTKQSAKVTGGVVKASSFVRLNNNSYQVTSLTVSLALPGKFSKSLFMAGSVHIEMQLILPRTANAGMIILQKFMPKSYCAVLLLELCRKCACR